jgi:hypothetical protein
MFPMKNKNIRTLTPTSMKNKYRLFSMSTGGCYSSTYIYWYSPKLARFMFYKRWEGKNNNSKMPKHPGEKWLNHKYTSSEMQRLPHQGTRALRWCLQGGKWHQNIFIVNQAGAWQGFCPCLVPRDNFVDRANPGEAAGGDSSVTPSRRKSSSLD